MTETSSVIDIHGLEIDGHKFITGDGFAQIGTEGGFTDLTLEDLGSISEFLATAWLNIAGEEYKPVEVGVSVHKTVLSARDCE